MTVFPRHRLRGVRIPDARDLFFALALLLAGSSIAGAAIVVPAAAERLETGAAGAGAAGAPGAGTGAGTGGTGTAVGTTPASPRSPAARRAGEDGGAGGSGAGGAAGPPAGSAPVSWRPLGGGLGGAAGASALGPVGAAPIASGLEGTSFGGVGGAVPAVGQVVAPSPAPPVEVPLRVLVRERGTRRPLEGAAVTVDTRPAGETDGQGQLALSLPIGTHQIEAQYPSHAPHREAVEMVAGRAYEVTIRLDTETDGERYETEVRSSHREVSSVAIDAREAAQVAGTSGDPIRVLASLPGVTQAVWPAAIFVVRGSNPGNTGFFIDGIRVPAAFHLALGPSLVAPELLSSLEFFPGAYPASFGRYISGVVSIHSARPPEDRVHVNADIKFYEARAVVMAPYDGGRGVVAAAFRYSYTKPLLSFFDKDTTIDYRDYQLRVDHALGGGQFTMFAFGSLDRLDNETVSTQSPMAVQSQTAALQFHRLDLRWSGPAVGGHLLAGVTGEYDHAQSSLAQAPITVGTLGVAPRLKWSRRLGRSFELEAGADAEYQHFEAHQLPFVTGNTSDLGRSRPALSQGTFVSLRILPGERLAISPGLRADLFVEENTSRFVPEPRLDARLDVKPWFALLLNLGRFSQMPSLPVSVAAFESFGLASIGLQRSDAISGGFNARTPDDTSFEVIGFYQRMVVTDVTDLDLQTGKVTGDSYLVLHDGVGYGVQAMIRRPDSHRLSGWLSYTLSYSLRNGTNGVVRSDWDQRHVLNLVLAYRGPAGFSFGATFHYNTGREVPVLPSTKRVQVPDFYRLDLRIERKFVLDRFVLTPYLDVANVTFQRDLVQYVATTSGSVPTYLRLVLPTLGLIGYF